MRVFLALILGIIIGAAALWYYSTSQGKSQVKATTDQMQSAAKSASDALQQKLHSLNLGTNDIREELARTGRIVRQKASQAGKAISDATADTRITAAIKARLLANRALSGLSISVNTTDGVVTLSGSVPAAEDIGKAMVVALDTDGVKQVISTIQVRPAKS